MAKIESKLVGPGAASRILEVSTEAVRNFGARGLLPTVRTVDNRTLYSLDAVERLAVERSAAKAAPDAPRGRGR